MTGDFIINENGTITHSSKDICIKTLKETVTKLGYEVGFLKEFIKLAQKEGLIDANIKM
jgi:hypothetical protein